MKRKSIKLAAILMAMAASSTMLFASCNNSGKETSADSSAGSSTGSSSTAANSESSAVQQGDPYEVIMTYLY